MDTQAPYMLAAREPGLERTAVPRPAQLLRVLPPAVDSRTKMKKASWEAVARVMEAAGVESKGVLFRADGEAVTQLDFGAEPG